MGTGQFNNPITGAAGALLRTLIKSANYVAGSLGWAIYKDGTAEFNSVTIRNGQVVSGTALYYNGTPALHTLIASVSATGGTDTFGNTYPDGVAVFDPNGTGHYINMTSDPAIGIGVAMVFKPTTLNAGLIEADGSAGFSAGRLILQPPIDPSFGSPHIPHLYLVSSATNGAPCSMILDTQSTGTVSITAATIDATAGSSIVKAGDYRIDSTVSMPRGIPVASGSIVSPASTGSTGTTTSGGTETFDAVWGTYQFIVPSDPSGGRWYILMVTGAYFQGTVVGDRFIARVRDGGSSAPTTASTLLVSSAAIPVYVAGASGNQPVNIAMLPVFLTTGTHTLQVSLVRSSGTGTATPVGTRYLYVMDIGNPV